MYRLTRQVRFAINAAPDDQLSNGRPSNSFAGFPSLTGLGHFFALDTTLQGPLHPQSQYLLNIKQIDAAVRQRVIPLIELAIRAGAGGGVIRDAFDVMKSGWSESIRLHSVVLWLSPYLSLSAFDSELPMIRMSQKFEFSASHRLHNPALSDEANRQTFGKCNNPHGHGHNYELQVTLRESPAAPGVPAASAGSGMPMPLVELERLVSETVIDRFDHKNLNEQAPEFAELIPSVENIARVIYQLLKPRLQSGDAGQAQLASVTVWETPKTFCEYSE